MTEKNHTLLFRIIVPSDTVAEINSEMVVIPGKEGVFGVLPGHAKFTSSVNMGVVEAEVKGARRRFFVYEGVAQVTGLEVNIVTEFAADLEQIDKNHVLNKITELKSEMADKDKGSIEERIIERKIEKYEALMSFV